LELEILEELGVGDLGGAWSWRPWRSLELEALKTLDERWRPLKELWRPPKTIGERPKDII
jgi:hypothetical protein